MERFPTPPPLDPQTVRDLVRYAEQVVRYLEDERAECRARDLPAGPLPELIAGWDFVATALAESYDLPGLRSP